MGRTIAVGVTGRIGGGAVGPAELQDLRVAQEHTGRGSLNDNIMGFVVWQQHPRAASPGHAEGFKVQTQRNTFKRAHVILGDAIIGIHKVNRHPTGGNRFASCSPVPRRESAPP